MRKCNYSASKASKTFVTREIEEKYEFLPLNFTNRSSAMTVFHPQTVTHKFYISLVHAFRSHFVITQTLFQDDLSIKYVTHHCGRICLL